LTNLDGADKRTQIHRDLILKISSRGANYGGIRNQMYYTLLVFYVC